LTKPSSAARPDTLENFWSLLKHRLHGTYVSVEPFHLFRYLDEEAFRDSERELTDAERFEKTLAAIAGKRLTYDHLTGRDHDAAQNSLS
jgi:hypothetical protein